MPPDAIASGAEPAPQCLALLLGRRIGPDWRCLTDAMIRAGGESGPIDLLALHPRHGAVLVALLRNGEEASPEEAAAAFRTMLQELDVAGRFPGAIKVVAVAHKLGRHDRLADAIRDAAGAAPESPPDPAWVDWMQERLGAPAKEGLRVVLPARKEEPPCAAAPRIEAPGERLAPPLVPRRIRRHGRQSPRSQRCSC